MTEEVENMTSSMNFLGMFTVGDFPLLFSKSNLMALIVLSLIHIFRRHEKVISPDKQ